MAPVLDTDLGQSAAPRRSASTELFPPVLLGRASAEGSNGGEDRKATGICSSVNNTACGSCSDALTSSSERNDSDPSTPLARSPTGQQALTLADTLREVISGVTVALAMVPEAVAFSLAAGLRPSIGIASSFIVCIVTTVLGGRPAMVSGATGSIAALIGPIVQEYGPEYLFFAVILMGFVQIVMGIAGVGNLVRLVPASVEIGFANGLALVIGLSQLNSYKIPGQEVHTTSSENHAPEVFKPFVDGVPWEHGTVAACAGAITSLSFLISVFLPRLTQRVPSALTGIVVGTAFEWGVVRAIFHSHTTLVGDMGSAGGSFPTPVWFVSQYDMPGVSGSLIGKIYKLSILMAIVGILESAMTLTLIDERTKSKGNVMRECIGQGTANIICGMCGGMGGCAMLGQSMINVSAGARGRISTLSCSVFLLFILLVAYPAINVLPVAALAGVMFNVVLQTFEWGSLRLLAVAALPKTVRECLLSKEYGQHKKIRRVDAAVIVLVTVMTLLADLAVAVGCGIIFACLMHIYDAATMINASSWVERDAEDRVKVKVYDVHGVLFFGSVSAFLNLFDAEGDPKEVRIIFETSYISDFSAVEALNKLGQRYAELGKRITVQLLHPGSSRIVDKAANLLVKEIRLTSEGGRVLDTPPFRHNIESYSQSFAASREGESSVLSAASRGADDSDVGLRRRAAFELPQ